MRFSSALAKMVPFASLAMQVGFSDAKTSTIGPAISLGVSAETQLWSSGGLLSSSSVVVLAGAAEEEGESSVLRVLADDLPGSEGSRCLRFLGLSPLNVKGLTIFGGDVMWLVGGR